MKLCRFELLREPGSIHSGIAYEGRVYETKGTEAVGIHEADQIQLLSPISRPSSIRYYLPNACEFAYGNPNAVFGPNATRPNANPIAAMAALVMVIGGRGSDIDPADADGVVLGLCLGVALRCGEAGGQTFDGGTVIGPVLTTPDEFEDEILINEQGREYHSFAAVKRNEDEPIEFQLWKEVCQPATLLSAASKTCALAEGDVFVLGFGEVKVGKGDSIRVSHPKLGVLSVRLD